MKGWGVGGWGLGVGAGWMDWWVDTIDVKTGVAPAAKQTQQRQRRWRTYAKQSRKKGKVGTEVMTAAVETHDDGDWECNTCTYINDATAARCELCYTPMPASKGRVSHTFLFSPPYTIIDLPSPSLPSLAFPPLFPFLQQRKSNQLRNLAE